MTGKETHDTPLDVRAALTRAFNAGVSFGIASHKDFVQIHEPVHVVVQSLVGRVCKHHCPACVGEMDDARQVIERCADALADLGACDDPDCTYPNCNHALPLAMEWLRKKEDKR